MPEFEYVATTDGLGQYLVWDVVPGFINCHSGCRGGRPTIHGVNLYTEAVYDRIIHAGESVEDTMEDFDLTRDQVIAALCFRAGAEWQKGAAKRKRYKDEAERLSWDYLSRKHPKQSQEAADA